MQSYIDRLRERYVDQPIKWAAIAGFTLALIAVFGPWATVDLVVVNASSNGFSHNGALIFILALASLGAIGAYVYANLNLPLSTLMWGLAGAALVIDLLTLLALLDIGSSEVLGIGWGLLVAVLGAVLCSAGTIVPMWSQIQSKAGEMRQGNQSP